MLYTTLYRLLKTYTKNPGQWEGICMVARCTGEHLELADKSVCKFYWVSKDRKLRIISGPMCGCYGVKLLQSCKPRKGRQKPQKNYVQF